MKNTRLKSALNGRSTNLMNSGHLGENARQTTKSFLSPTASVVPVKNHITTNEDGYPVGLVTR